MHAALSATPPETAWLITTGAMTNAAALLAAHPDLASHLAGVSIMGGAVGGGFTAAPMGHVKGEGERFGNWTPYAEFNIYCDPEAANAVFTSPILAPKTTLIPLDVTHQCLATRAVRRMLLFGGNGVVEGVQKIGELRAMFYQVLTFFAKTYADVFDLRDGPPLHDPLAVLATYDPSVFDDRDGERFAVVTVTEGQHSENMSQTGQLGRTVVTKLPKGEPGIRIPRSLDVEKFWYLIDEAIKKAEIAGQGAVRGLTEEEMTRFGQSVKN
jgi:uridine nucleosidase